jgi:hypothetical protein
MSINLTKISNFNETKRLLFEKAHECKVESYYYMFEHFGKNRKVLRNHFILTCLFSENEELLADFIRYAKKISVNIESVGFETGKFELMYASKKYLNMMEKEFVDRYLNLKRENKLYRQDSIIFKTILKKY